MTGSRESHAEWLRDAFEHHHRRLLAYALRVTGGRHDLAEEAVQETFLRLCRQNAADLEGRLSAWLFKVCRSRIIDMQRTHHAPPPTSLADPERPEIDRRCDQRESPAQSAESSEMRDRLRERVESLPARQRELLYLKIHGQLSYREIADATGLSVSNVGYLLHQAMQSLRNHFSATDA